MDARSLVLVPDLKELRVPHCGQLTREILPDLVTDATT
jgi:hypothetical protein